MIDRRLQQTLIGAYRLVLRTGVFETRLGYAALERCYDVYKSSFEAAWLAHARGLTPPGSTVVDVGAHTGFFTQQFAARVGREGQVIALEPEPVNFQRLRNRIQRHGLANRVTTINAAATESVGEYRLKVDPGHPADHQIAESGLAIRGVTLDEILAGRGWPPVSLIKLDIQGAETRALKGATATLDRLRPALLVEVDNDHLVAQGSSADGLLDLLETNGYVPRRIERSGISGVIDRAEALRLATGTGRYIDLVFFPPEP